MTEDQNKGADDTNTTGRRAFENKPGEEQDGLSVIRLSNRELQARSLNLVRRGLQSLAVAPEVREEGPSQPFYEGDLDPITGLARSRRFRLAIASEVERWRRYAVPCALLLLEVDRLKTICERFGDSSRDLIFRDVGTVLRSVCRGGDTAALLGGEVGTGPSLETARLFALLLSNIDDINAAPAAERLKAILTRQYIEGVGNITVSLGVAACPVHADSERMLFEASDSALQVAKDEGGNRISIAPIREESKTKE
jgi:diguanylate cyclase (GGDEF)-like protein